MVLAVSLVGTALFACAHAGAPRRAVADPCVTTDPVVVAGQQILPSQTVCVPPSPPP